MEDLFRDYWWLIFPIFGMAMAIYGMAQDEQRTRARLDLIKSYVDQGKEPPAELLKFASQDEDGTPTMTSPSKRNSGAWTFVTFAALAAGFGFGWYMIRGEDFSFAFAIVAVTMTVMAVGSLLILLFSRR